MHARIHTLGPEMSESATLRKSSEQEQSGESQNVTGGYLKAQRSERAVNLAEK